MALDDGRMVLSFPAGTAPANQPEPSVFSYSYSCSGRIAGGGRPVLVLDGPMRDQHLLLQPCRVCESVVGQGTSWRWMMAAWC
jgi:hypothetical protein